MIRTEVDPVERFIQRIQSKPTRWEPKPLEALDTKQSEWLTGLPFMELAVADGTVKRFYTIGALASLLDISQVTIRSWEAKGWLPKPAYRTPPPNNQQLPGRPPKGRRLYTEEQLRFLATKYEEYIKVKRDWPSFRKAIAESYPTR